MENSYDAWIGRDVYDSEGEKVGTIEDVYYDNVTSQPEWLAISTGMFGSKRSFAPIAGSSVQGDELRLLYTKEQVKDAPKAEGDLDAADEEALFAHYNVNTLDPEYGVGERADTGYGHQGRREDDAMTRSEEELRVSTERRETGTARLRKYVVTEQRQITVPVTREEVRVEREPITEANRGAAMSGAEISEAEHTVVTHEEVPVVTKETVPKERVRLEKETVTEQETVSGQVRKEQIEVEDDTQDSKPVRR